MADFIKRHSLWTDDEFRQAQEVAGRVSAEGLRLIRLVWVDSHGQTRAKQVSAGTFTEVLRKGYNINVATFTLDASGSRVFSSFVRGGGMDLDEMTGSPNLVIVPDPASFRVLPWSPDTGWILCDEFFTDGRPFYFSNRRLLRDQVIRLAGQGMSFRVGLEIEWYLHRLLEPGLQPEEIAEPGRRGSPPPSLPVDPGAAYHSETNIDRMQPMLIRLAEVWEGLGLQLRSVENEFGAGQVECTFTADSALRAADDFILFRTATRQICRRHQHLASFMCWPASPGAFPSGWHLHQSLVSLDDGRNLMIPEAHGEDLSATGLHWLAGLMEHAIDGTVFSTPSINGYRRFRANSLAPDRVCRGHDHRGVMLRTLGGPGDPGSRIENRIGEPAANPYLFFASQIAAGLDGIERGLTPPPPDTNPYEADRPRLPTSLRDALTALDGSKLYRQQFGERYIDYYFSLKRSEADRFDQQAETSNNTASPSGVTRWEQNEYFDFF